MVVFKTISKYISVVFASIDYVTVIQRVAKFTHHVLQILIMKALCISHKFSNIQFSSFEHPSILSINLFFDFLKGFVEHILAFSFICILYIMKSVWASPVCNKFDIFPR